MHHVCRQTIADHVQSAKHRTRNNNRQANTSDAGPAPKRQATITGYHDRQTGAAAAKEKIIASLVESFMAANIPLDKLDNPKMCEFFGDFCQRWRRHTGFKQPTSALRAKGVQQAASGHHCAAQGKESRSHCG